MLSFTQYLSESQEINLSMKAYKTLSYNAQDAIDSWEAFNWAGGILERAYASNNAIAQEIDHAFEPVRSYLHQKFGNSIKLYRGVYPKTNDVTPKPNRILYSWTSEKKTAEIFAGFRNYKGEDLRRPNILSDDDIDRLYKKYLKDGFLKYGSHIYKKNDNEPSLKEPDYYNIYSLSSRHYITDGTDIKDQLRTHNDWNKEHNERYQRGKILEKDIPIDHIVWVTNNLNSKEFIVRNK